ncbi:MAG: hypothetical protein MUE91_13190, partial [Ignavibacteriaceae bacterium]|nr:hypothetical protein [Ignavibacteriaceae bacterium]
KGKYRSRNINDQFEGVVNINDAEEIQIDKFNLLNTILLGYVAASVVAVIVLLFTKPYPIFED